MFNYQSSILDELIVDNFAGGGGASTGIELAVGRRRAKSNADGYGNRP